MADHALLASVYDRVMAPTERAGLAERRRRLLARATGRVLEIGAGTGANLAHYRDVESVTVLEPDGAMRRRLREKLAVAAVPVEVHEIPIDASPFPDASFDTVVSTLVLCSVGDPGRALGEVRRLLRPGGSLLFVEHVLGHGVRGRVQRAAAPVWKRLAGGCRPDRDTVGAIRGAGFVIGDLERFDLPRANVLVRPCVQGVARPTGAAA